MVAAAVVGAATIGAGIYAADKASSTGKKQAQAVQQSSDASTGLQREIYQTNRNDLMQATGQATDILGAAGSGAISRLDPYATTGANALGVLGNLSGANGADAARSAMEGFTTSPGYDFRLSEGTKALERSAAARGGLLSGSTLKGITQYGQGVASDEFGQYWNRLASLASSGQQAAGQQGNWQMATGQGTANALVGASTQGGQWGQSTANSISAVNQGTGTALAQIAGNTSAAQTGAVNNALNNSIYFAGRQGWLS